LIVGSGKDESGFHGTTIQAVVPCPSSHIHTPFTMDSVSIETKITRDRSLSSDIVQPLVNQKNKIDPPTIYQGNKFANLVILDLDVTPEEISSFNIFTNYVHRYGFTKFSLQEKNIQVPGIKTFLSVPMQDTKKSEFKSIAVLEETADKKETVLQVLNILHDKFDVGHTCKYIVIVGDGKSYDHLINLTTEYDSSLSWVLPYPGDGHILKNVLPIFMKIYLDAGLKPLAAKFHHSSTYRMLTDCIKFSVTHRLCTQVWEAILRHQIHAFLSVSENITTCRVSFEDAMNTILSDVDLDDVEEICNESLWTGICTRKKELFSFFVR
jgi:hypothetical protein